jgi:hypothetical protein
VPDSDQKVAKTTLRHTSSHRVRHGLRLVTLKPKPSTEALSRKRRRVRSRNACASGGVGAPCLTEQLCFQFWFATPISFIWIKSLIEADWLIARGNNLKITDEFLNPGRAPPHGEETRWGLVYEFTPIQFAQIR